MSDTATQNTLTISTADGDFSAFVAQPTAHPAPVIVVIQEIFGINEDMRTTCRQLAAQGYLAVCPDLFWRQEPGVSLTDKTQAEWDKAFALYQGFDVAKGVEDIAATLAAARALPQAGSKAGVVGYCLGGLLAYLSAARTDVDAAVSYYGVGIEGHLGEAESIDKALLMHMGEADGFVSPEARAQIIAALQSKPEVQVHVYPGCDHAFARNAGVHFDADAAQLANSRTAEFFAAQLK